VSQTPTEAGDPVEDYKLGWVAINKLVDQGFSWSGHERNCVFLNQGSAPFASVSAVAGLNWEDDGRAVAPVDWDMDGDLDLFATNRTGPRLRFLRNGLNSNGGYLQLKLQGTEGNRDGIGARVEVLLQDAESAPMLQTRRAGDGYMAQSSGWMHFGLGAESAQAVRVTWPNGKTETFSDVQANQRYLLVQGSGEAKAWSAPVAEQKLAPSLPEPPRARSSARVVLASPVPMPQLAVESADGRVGELFGVEARIKAEGRVHQPILVQLWASWCAPCAQEMAAFTTAADDFAAAGVEVLALNIEPKEARAKALAMVESMGWPHLSGFAAGNTVEVLDTLQGSILRQDIRIPVPSSFLIDGNGNLVAFYLGRVEPEQIVQDLELVAISAEERIERALPFPGRWFEQPPEQSPMYLERKFHDRGLHAAAREYQPGWIHLQFGRALAAQGQLPRAEEQFRLALATGPYYVEAYLGIGKTLHLQGRPNDAVELYKQALQIDENNESVIYFLGLAHLARKDRPAAQAQLEKLSALGSSMATELERRLKPAEGD
jgi:tetratricopeptide (TPR) repeat protein